MKSYRRTRDSYRRDVEKHEPSSQGPMILERRNVKGETTRQALYNPEKSKTNIKVLQATTPVIQQQHSTFRPSVKKQQTTISSNWEDNDTSTTTIQQQQEEEERKSRTSYIPFFRRGEQFHTESINKVLTDSPGHFVVGIVGQQGVGKSTILSSFTEQSTNAFPTQSKDLFLAHGHKTSGIDMYICPERMILLDTEPILCWSVLEKAIRHHLTDGLSLDLWLEMEALYNLVFLLSVCNVVMVVLTGTDIDVEMIRCLQRAEMLKFHLPDFPLIPPSNFGQTHHDMNYYSDIVFICNKCQNEDFTLSKYKTMQSILTNSFYESQLKTKGIGSLGKILPGYQEQGDGEENLNLYFLPFSKHLCTSSDKDNVDETFQMVITSMRDQIMAAPRRPGKKGQVSEKEWFRNAVKIYELTRNSEYIADYIKTLRKLRDG
ncbi:uncharacterized protein BX664DRAFT_382500 [Halteromyces radiatus]|uniref:uncharacterized protein n=1 Tax=Halteromyces radiatus TaxID=101107 RepID=UPI00221F479F|nr:uncharacterized protein BX664DRAFT_382500 [Halteromyces radiatus]KAI8100059.1 hypothetical protein BX664DRAFT_382500 [Halteromyces radiatus]